MLLFFYLLLILLTECFMWSKSIPNGSAKSQNKLKYSSQAQKILPIDELHMRQNGFLLQLQAIYALHYSFAISFFYYFVFCSAPLSSFFLFLLSALWLSKPWNQLALLPSLSLLFLLLPRLLLLLLLLQISDGDGLCVILL